ncbi:hypothetical protein CC78DRAFT_528094 [Lojkania enalia]|uniref:Mucin-7 n=1 Tax=Lojkania enalia TaxID=147567 RepID=A0A9P4TSA2_9PLEO|nr:hypothetical protein CC78DRAFT_528094 [Didymosphaeria enalia]
MTENRASSGVRNLRAMFENPSAASSPEPRGRSPAGRDLDTPGRPTSKIRASFVSVEPSVVVAKDLGTIKGTPEGVNHPQAQRRESFSVSQDLEEETTELKKIVSQEADARKDSNATPEVVPEEAVASRESSRPAPPIRQTTSTMPNLGRIMKGSDFPEPETKGEEKPQAQEIAPKAAPELEPVVAVVDEKPAASPAADAPGDNLHKIVSEAQVGSSLKLANPKNEVDILGGEALPPMELPPSTSSTETSTEAPKAAASTPSKAKVNGTSNYATPSGKTAAKKPAAISTSKAATTKASSSKSPLPKSPGVARLPKTPTTPKPTSSASTSKAPMASKPATKVIAPKEQSKAPAPKTSRASLRPSTTSTTASAAAKAKAPVLEAKKPNPKTAAPAPKENTTTSPSGFKKPRPKSPTRPIRLPSHLTAPTASSAAKHEEDGQKLARKPSTVSRPTAPKTAPTARKQPSRASLVPSSASTTKRPESRNSTRGAPDESFLARMMRPTTSSASKTHEKVSSPPRRGASVRVSAKPKPGEGSTVAKGKAKVSEAVSKTKETVTNGHGEHADPAPAEPTTSNGTAEETQTLLDREATPTEQVESSVAEIQTPSFEEQVIR